MSSLVIYSTLTFIAIAIGWFAYKVYIWPYYLSPLRNIPGPPSDSLISGNFKRFFAGKAGEVRLEWIKKYGNFVKYHGLLNQQTIIVTDAKLIQEILSNQAYDFPKFAKLRGDLKYIIGLGLTRAEGNDHKRQRKMMNPAFARNIVKDMIPVFVHVALTLKGLIEDKVNKGESKIILDPYISKVTLDIIGLVGFNHNFNSLTSKSELEEAYSAFVGTNSNTLNYIISILSVYAPFIRKIPTAINKRYNHTRKTIERESKKLMEEKYNDDKNNKLDGVDLLSRLFSINKTLPIEEKMTDDELRYQIMTILIAGHKTTAVALGWALCMLAQHPNEQDLLREELVKAFPDRSKFNPTFDEINSLEHLNCIVKETLRLYPPVIVLQRRNVKDDKVIGEHFVPKGTPVDIPIAAIHRLPSIWGPTADDFDPKRWLDPSLIKKITNYNYLPFSTGARFCIGNKIALNEFKIVLSILVRNFVFQPVEGLHIKRSSGLSIRPSPRLELMVSKVEV